MKPSIKTGVQDAKKEKQTGFSLNSTYRRLDREFKKFTAEWRESHPIHRSESLFQCPESSDSKVYVYVTKYMFNNPITVKSVLDTIEPKKRNLRVIFVIATRDDVSVKSHPDVNTASLSIIGNSNGVEVVKDPSMVGKLEKIGEPYFVLDSIYSLKAEGKIDDFGKIYSAVTPSYY